MAREVDLNLLPHLQALLELRNVSRAAERTLLSQSAMSNALARLRRHFNDELLVRVGREYELTPFAQDLAPLVDSALTAVQDAMQLQSRFDPTTSERTFVIAASDYVTSLIIRPLRQRITELHARVGVDIVPSARLGTGLEAFNHIDLLIGPDGYGFDGSSRRLFRDEFVVLMDSENPLLAQESITIDDLIAAPQAVGEFGAGVLTPPMRFFADLGHSLTPAARVGGWQVLPFLVEGTDLVTIVPRSLVSRISASLRVTPVEFDPALELPIVESMHWHPLQNGDPANTWLRSLLQYVCADIDGRAPISPHAVAITKD